jgi:hypothetical protein
MYRLHPNRRTNGCVNYLFTGTAESLRFPPTDNAMTFHDEKQFKKWLWSEELELFDKISHNVTAKGEHVTFIIKDGNRLYSLPADIGRNSKIAYYWEFITEVKAFQKKVVVYKYMTIPEYNETKREISTYNKDSVIYGNDTVGWRRRPEEIIF